MTHHHHHRHQSIVLQTVHSNTPDLNVVDTFASQFCSNSIRNSCKSAIKRLLHLNEDDMKVPQFFIQLDNPIRSYFPGQTITGRVVLNNDKPKDLKNISITFEGNATVHWTETVSETIGSGKDQRTQNRVVHYTAKENYFTAKILLFGNDRNSITLPTGTVSYQFQFTLPLNLPSSFTSRIGMVHYLMEARMKRTWHKSDLNAIVPFTVNGILDLNQEPGVAQSVCYEKQKNICCLCCKSGPVGYKIALQRTGFVPGEFAQFNAEFTNHSRRKIKGVNLTLVQISTFHAQGKSTTERKDILKAVCPPIEPGDSDYWGGEILRIPALPPSRLASCRIIDVQYVLRFELNLSGITINMVAEIPIVIGTIPFRNTFMDFMPSSTSVVPGFSGGGQPPFFNQLSVDNLPGYSGNVMGFGASPMVPPQQGPAPSAPVFDMYPDLPPPSYAEAMQTDKFEYNMGGGDDGQSKTNLGFSDNQEILDDEQQGPSSAQSPGPSAPPPGFDYVPNYITYKTHHK